MGSFAAKTARAFVVFTKRSGFPKGGLMFKIAIAFTACLTCLVFAVPSRADTVEQSGYVCSAAFVPTNGSGMAPAANKGRLGYVTFDL